MPAGVNQFLCLGEPHQQRRGGVRDYTAGLLAQRTEHMSQGERRAHGIAIRTDMADNRHFAGIGKQAVQPAHIFFFNYSIYHRSNYSTKIHKILQSTVKRYFFSQKFA